MSNDTSLLQILASILEVLSDRAIDSADLQSSVLGPQKNARLQCDMAYIAPELVAHGLANGGRLLLEQLAVGAVHTDAVIGFKKPAARTSS